MSVVLFLFGKNRLLYRYPYHNPFEVEHTKTKQGEADHKQVTSTTVNTHPNLNALPPKGDKSEFTKCVNTSHSNSSSSTASEGLSVSSKTTTSTTTTTSTSSNSIMRRQGVRMHTSASQESLYHRYSNNNNVNNEEFTVTQPSTEVNGDGQNGKSKTLQHSSSAINLSNNSFGSNRFEHKKNSNNNDTSQEVTLYKQGSKLEEEYEGVLENEEDDHYSISNMYNRGNNDNYCYGGKNAQNEEGQLYCSVSSSRNGLSSESHFFSSSGSSEKPLYEFRTPPKLIIAMKNNNNNKNKTQNKRDIYGNSTKDSNEENTFCIYTQKESNNINKNLYNREKRKINKARLRNNNNDDLTTIKHNIFTRLYEDEEMDKVALRELLEIIQNNIQLHEKNNNNGNNDASERKQEIEQWLEPEAPYEMVEIITRNSVNDLHSMLRYVGDIRLERPIEISCIGLSHIALEQLLRATPSSCATLHFAHVTLLLYRIVLSDETCVEQQEEEKEEYPFMESEEELLESEEESYFDNVNVEKKEKEENINNQRRERYNEKKSNQDASSVMLVIALNRGDDAQNSLASFVQCIVNVWCREELREQYISREINTIEHTNKILEFYDDKSNVEVGPEFISSTSSINTYGTNRTQNVNMKKNVEKMKTRTENSLSRAFTETNVEQEEKRMNNSEYVRNVALTDEINSNNTDNNTEATNTSITVRTINMFNFLFLYLRHNVTLLRTCRELVKVLDLWMRVLRQVEPSELNKLTRQAFPWGNSFNSSREHNNEYGVHCSNSNNNNKIMDVVVYKALSKLPDGLWINRHLYLPLWYLLGYTPSEYTSESNNNNKNKVEFKWPHPCISVHVCNDVLQECERNRVLSEREEQSNKQSTEKQLEENKGQLLEGNSNNQDNCMESNKATNKMTHSLIALWYKQNVGEWFAKYLPWNTIATFLLNSQCSFTFGTLYRYLECVLLTNIRDNLYKSKIAKLNKYINAETNKEDKLSSHSAYKRRQHSTSSSLCSPCTNTASTCVLLKAKESQRSSLPNSQLTSPCTNLEQPQPQPQQQPSSSSLTSSPTLSCSGMQKLKREESYSHRTRHSSKRNIKCKAIRTKKQEIIKEANFVAFQQVIKYSPALTKIGSFLESHAFIRNESESKLHVSLSQCELAPLESIVAMYFDSNNICEGSSANEPSLVIPPLLFMELLQTNTNKYNESYESHETSLALSQNEPLTKSNESANTFTWPGSASHQLTLPQKKEKGKEAVASTRTSPYLTSAMSPVSSKSVNINNGKAFSFSKFSRDKHVSGSASSNRQVIGISSPLLLPEQQQEQQIQELRKEITFPINNGEDVEVETPLVASPWLDASSPITPLSALMDTRHSSWASYTLPWKLESEWLHKRSDANSAQSHAQDKHKEHVALGQTHQMSLESGISICNRNSKKSNCLSKTPEANQWTVESSSLASSQRSWTVTHSWKGTENAAQQPSLHSFDERHTNREGKHNYLHEEREEEEEESLLEQSIEEKENKINGIDAHDESYTHENANVQVHVEKSTNPDNDNYTEGKTGEADYTREKYIYSHLNKVRLLPKLRVHCVWGKACPFCEALAASASVQRTPHSSTTESYKYNYSSELHVEEAINSKTDVSKTTDCNNTSTDSYSDNAEEVAVAIENSLEKNVQYKWQFTCNRSDRRNVIYVELEFPLLHFNVLKWTRQCALYEYTMMQIASKSKQGKVIENVHGGNDNATKKTRSSYHKNNNSLNLHEPLKQPFAIYPSSVSYSESLQKQHEQEVEMYEPGEHPYHSCDFSVASCTHKERPWFVRPEIYFSTHTSHMYSPLEMYHDLLTTSQEHKPHYKNMKHKLQNESVHSGHSRLAGRHGQGKHSENKYLPWTKEEEEEQEEEPLEEDVEEDRELLSSKEFTQSINELNQNNNDQVRSQNSEIMRQMRLNWSSSKNGKTGSIDDTELTLWMNTHPDVTAGDDIDHFNNNSNNKSEKVFIDGIIISHEASAWLQRNSHTLRQRLVYEMELAEAIHSMLVIYQTQKEGKTHVNMAKLIGTDINNDNNKLEVQPIHVNATQTQPISVSSHQTCKSDNMEITNLNKEVKVNTSIRLAGAESRQLLPSLQTESSEESSEEESKDYEKPSPMKASASLPSSLISSLSKSRYLRYNKRQLPQRNVNQCMSPLSLEPNSWHATPEKKVNNSSNPAMHQSLLSHSYNSRNHYQNNSEERRCNNNNKSNANEMIRRSSTNYLTDTNVSLNVNGSTQNTCYTPLTDTSSNKINIYTNYNIINNNNHNNNNNNSNMTENEKQAHDNKESQTTQLSISRETNEECNKVELNTSSLAKGTNSGINNINSKYYNFQNKSSPKEQLGKSINALSTSQWLAHLHLRFLPHDILLQCAIHMTIILLWSHAQVEIAMLQRQLERLLHHLSTLLSNLQYVNQLIVAGYSSRQAWKLMCEQESDHHGHVKGTRQRSGTKRDQVDQTTTVEQITKSDSNTLQNSNDNNISKIEQENEKRCKEHLAYSSLPPTPSPTSTNTFTKNNNNAAMAILPVMSDAFVPSANDVHLLQLYELFNEMCVTQLIAPYNGCKLPQIPTPLLLHAIINEISDVLSIN